MILTTVLALACAAPPSTPLKLEGAGSHRRAVSGASPQAQQWFDQGLNVVFAFNHDEAVKDFAEAARLSPGCAMAHWGVAYANGPHINKPDVDPANATAAWEAVQKAQAAAAKASPVEQALIGALSERYANPAPADRASLDGAYADAMREVYAHFPKDADVAALTAEALMDVHPWQMWKDDGSAQPWTEEILTLIRAGLKLDPEHPMLHHLYIHAVEGSPHPELAAESAEVLGKLAPGLGHLVHMPSHIFIRTGRWSQAIDANEKAIAQDKAYHARAPKQGFYTLYMMHNNAMLMYAAMMSGRSALALDNARQMLAKVSPEYRKSAAGALDAYYAMPLEVLTRFGRWDAVLAEAEFPEDLPAARAIRHAARAVAFAAKGDVGHAHEEQALVPAAIAKVPNDSVFGNNLTRAVLAVAERMAAGEVLLRDGKTEEGLTALRKAVAREDALRYDEPPDWVQPMRHALGAALVRANKLAEAEAVFREDLRRVPKNGWGLFGLADVLDREGKSAEAKDVRADFDKIWAGADLKIAAACLCQQR